MGAAAAMSAHIYGGSSVIRMIIRNPPWRSGDPQGIPTPPHPTPSPTPIDPHARLGWGLHLDPHPTPRQSEA